MPLCGLPDISIFRFPGRPKQLLYFIVGEAVDQTRLTERSVTASLDDFAEHPLKVFLSLLVFRQDINGVFYRN